MGVKIYVPAKDVWTFFKSNTARLKKEMVAIAENEGTKYAVYLTEDKGYPSFSVCKDDGEAEYQEGAISERDCAETAARCYARYLFPIEIHNEKWFPESSFEDLNGLADKDLTEQDKQDNVYVREDELRFAMCDFLKVVLRLDCDPVEILTECGIALVDDVLDAILEYIGVDLGLEVYRPMFLVDEQSGDEVYSEYPYDTGEDLYIASRFDGFRDTSGIG